MSDDSGKRELVANPGTGEVAVSADASMPPVEPGHKGHELNPGEIFDPNAARRFAEGRGPGLQDSEIIQPAHWVQADSYEETPEGRKAYLEALRREEAQYDRPDAKDRKSEVGKEIARVETLVRKDEKAEQAQA
jgi:hypothetical protein